MTEIDEILKFDPGAAPEQPPPSTGQIDEILKFDPGPIGGTYQEKEPPFPGATPPISTITGKPETKYMPGEEPGADIFTLIKTGLVDDPQKQIEIFAKARGIPKSRYRIFKGDIIFRNKANKWQREVGDLPTSALKKAVIQTVSNPAVILGTVGAAAGAPGAVLGAMGGAGIRKAIGGIAFGEEQTIPENLLSVATEGILAAGGEVVGKGIGRIIGRVKLAGKGGAKYAGREVAEGLLTKEDHAKAEVIRALAKRYNIELAPHQLYDKEGMTNIWMYLRKHPRTSDAVRAFEDRLANQTDESIQQFIKQLGGYEETPFIVGKKLQRAASQSIESAKDVRRVVASPLYKKAFTEGAEVDIEPVIKYIDDELVTAKGEIRTQLLKAKKILEKPDLPKVTKGEKPLLISPTGKPIGGTEDIINYDTTLQGLHGSKIEFDRIIENARQDSLGNTVKRHYQNIRELLLNQMDVASPTYAEARANFARLSKPVNALRESVIGELDKMSKESVIAKAPGKLFNIANMPDAKLLKTARSVIEPQDPELWKRIVGSYIRDTYEGLKVTEEGKILNAAGKLHKRLFGTKKQRELLQVALDKKDYTALKDLMAIFQRAAIGTSRQSMTAPFQAIAKEMGEIPGSALYRWGMFPRQQATSWVFGKWNDILMSGRQRALAEALTSPSALEQIRKMKPLTPGSRKLIDALAVYTSLISTKIGLEDIGESLPGERQGVQR